MTETIALPLDLARQIARLLPDHGARDAFTALIPEPDEAQEALVEALYEMNCTIPAYRVRDGHEATAVAIIREAIKPKMTPEIAADFRAVRQSIPSVNHLHPSLDRIEAQFRGEGK